MLSIVFSDSLTDITYNIIHTEKEFSKDKGSVLQQFTPQHYSQMLSDMFSGKKIV